MNNSISKSEAKVLQALWQKSPLDGKQIAALINAESWSYVTIKTLINRLLKKGHLSFTKDGRRYLYRAEISKKQYLENENTQFLQRLYAGSISSLIASFSEHEEISKSELDEIKLIIEKMEKPS